MHYSLRTLRVTYLYDNPTDWKADSSDLADHDDDMFDEYEDALNETLLQKGIALNRKSEILALAHMVDGVSPKTRVRRACDFWLGT